VSKQYTDSIMHGASIKTHIKFAKLLQC